MQHFPHPLNLTFRTLPYTRKNQAHPKNQALCNHHPPLQHMLSFAMAWIKRVRNLLEGGEEPSTSRQPLDGALGVSTKHWSTIVLA